MDPLKDTDEWETTPLHIFDAGEPFWAPSHVGVDVAGQSHPGRVRPNNEDHFLITRFGRFLTIDQSNLAADDEPLQHELTGHAFLVADGLGGHAAGETASKSAIRILFNLVIETPDWIFRLDERRLLEEVEHRAKLRMEQISQAMTQQADVEPDFRGYGTTLTLAWGLGERWILAHVGDSRVYRFGNGVLQQLTHDHTIAQRLADKGIIDQQHVRLHHLRHRLTQLLGDNMLNVAPQVQPFMVQDGDCLLLCSDGLTEMLTDDTIASILVSDQPAAECCGRLMNAALDAGGHDNVTVIVARLRLTDSKVRST